MTTTLARRLSPRAAWSNWTKPRSTDRDEAFREATIRVTTAVLILFMVPMIAIQILFFFSSPTTIPYSILITLSLILSSSAALTVQNRQLVTAGRLLTLNFLTIALSLAVIHGLWSITVTGTLFITLILGALVLPRQNLTTLTIIMLILILLINMLQNRIAPPLPDTTNSLDFATILLILLIPLGLAFLRQLRLEFDNRLSASTEAKDEALKAKDEALQANQVKNQFLANMSHELRTPLNAIIGFLELIQGGILGQIPEAMAVPLQRTLANAKHLLALINDLIDVSRIEAGRLEIHPTSFNPRDMLTDIVDNHQSLATPKGLTVKKIFSPETPEIVIADQKKLEQVVINLLGNALKFTKEGTISVIASAPTETTWSITVSDTGIGMPEDSIDKIWGVFSQLDNSDTRTHQGSGLGLAIAKRFIEAMNGVIQVESKLGQGTAFTVTLPRNITQITPPISNMGVPNGSPAQ